MGMGTPNNLSMSSTNNNLSMGSVGSMGSMGSMGTMSMGSDADNTLQFATTPMGGGYGGDTTGGMGGMGGMRALSSLGGKPSHDDAPFGTPNTLIVNHTSTGGDTVTEWYGHLAHSPTSRRQGGSQRVTVGADLMGRDSFTGHGGGGGGWGGGGGGSGEAAAVLERAHAATGVRAGELTSMVAARSGEIVELLDMVRVIDAGDR